METSSKIPDWDETYLTIADLIAQHSKATRAKVGAILVKDRRIISIGYNGTPSGFPNQCEWNGVTLPEVLHAESNAISKCARSVESSEGSTLYVTVSPCIECAKLIIQAGISKVYYREEYRDKKGLDLLAQACINTYQIKDSSLH